MPGIDFKFIDVDDASKTLPMGERGEICIKGPNVMKGYWNNEEATASSFTDDGFFRTGDVGYMDEDGFMYIVDRTKDMILCGGYNVYPRNIEEAIYQHPSVEEVSVIGIADEYRGEAPKAFIKLKDGASGFTLDEMKDFLKDKLGKHEMISDLDIRAELPKTLVGKLSKKELYEEEEKEAGRQSSLALPAGALKRARRQSPARLFRSMPPAAPRWRSTRHSGAGSRPGCGSGRSSGRKADAHQRGRATGCTSRTAS